MADNASHGDISCNDQRQGIHRLEGPDHPGRVPGQRHPRADAVPLRGAQGHRRLPAVHRRDRGPAPARSRLHHAGRRRHGRSAPRRPRLEDLRRQTLELIFGERNHICPFCPRSGNCELQTAGYEHHMTTCGTTTCSRSCRWTTATRTSPWTTTAASCAAGASGRATSGWAPTCWTSTTAARRP